MVAGGAMNAQVSTLQVGAAGRIYRSASNDPSDLAPMWQASAMRRYYFDMRVGDDLGEDEEGADLPDLDAVQKEALRFLADMAKELIAFPASMSVESGTMSAPSWMPEWYLTSTARTEAEGHRSFVVYESAYDSRGQPDFSR